jgi:hypothetical protein
MERKKKSLPLQLIAALIVALIACGIVLHYKYTGHINFIHTATNSAKIVQDGGNKAANVIKRLKESDSLDLARNVIMLMSGKHYEQFIVVDDVATYATADDVVFCGARVKLKLFASGDIGNINTAEQIVRGTIGDINFVDKNFSNILSRYSIGEKFTMYGVKNGVRKPNQRKREVLNKSDIVTYAAQIIKVDPVIDIGYYEVEEVRNGKKAIFCADEVEVIYTIQNAVTQEIYYNKKSSGRFKIGIGAAPVQLEKGIVNIGDGGRFKLKVYSDLLLRVNFYNEDHVKIDGQHWFDNIDIPEGVELLFDVSVKKVQ